MYSSHQSRTRKASDDHHRALFEAGYGGHERGTHEPHLLRGGSLYVKATKRPAVTLAALAGGGALAYSLLGRRRAPDPTPPRTAGDMAQLEPERMPADT